MFWDEEEDGLDLEELQQRFEAQLREGGVAHYSLAELRHLLEWYLTTEQTDKAYRVLDHAGYLYPDSVELGLWRSWLLYEEERFKEAYVEAMAAFPRLPLTQEVYEHLIQVCLAAEKMDTAAYIFEVWWDEAPEAAQRGQAAATLAEAYQRLRQPTQAIPILWRGWEADPSRSRYFVQRLVSAYWQSGQIPQGVQAFWMRIWEHPEEAVLWIGLGQLYTEKMAWSQAQQALQQAEILLEAQEEESAGTWAILYRARALLAEACGQEFEAFRAWLQVREYAPRHLQTLSRILDFYMRWQEWQAGEVYLRQLRHLAPRSPVLQCKIADFLWATQRIPEAVPYYRGLLRSKKYAPHATNRLFQAYFQLRDAEALYKLTQYVKRHLSIPDTLWLSWIAEAFQAQQANYAFFLAAFALRLRRRAAPQLYYWHAALALHKNLVREAVVSLEQALLADPKGLSLFYQAAPVPLPLPVQSLLRRYAAS